MPLPYINIHSHQQGQPGDWTIINLHQDWKQAIHEKQCSIGLHPWYLQADRWQSEWTEIQNLSTLPQVLALGECGLDRLCQIDWTLQITAFKTQLSWANEIRKPVIIHSVRAYEDILQLIRQLSVTIPCIFHGFNKNVHTARKIIEAGHYLSFGKAILQPSMAAVLSTIPDDRFFLETDDSQVSIRDIYHHAASARSIHLNSLILQQHTNFSTVFGRIPIPNK